MTFEDGKSLTAGEPLVFTHGKFEELYDFGYLGATGRIIVYIHNEMNGQDSYAIEPSKLRKADAKDLASLDWGR